ncbi:MAG: 50S ribosomal protein L29 [Alphaproteobacteria bacterium]|nr:50S ribosomal protein L29 [Alphaproteobacteria bacterium]OJV45050.1 MAG: 50S ribosomal protein L29 [Alphaproteobacteria bacterium 43-37]
MKENFASLSVDQLKEKLSDLSRERFNFAFQKATGQLENVARIRMVRREIARVLTFLKQKEKK